MRLKPVLYIAIPLLLAACVTTDKTAHEFTAADIAPQEKLYPLLSQNQLVNNVVIGSVTLSKKMPQASWDSPKVLSDTGFKQALEESFQKAGWFNNTNPRYTLNALLLNQKIPFSLTDKKTEFSVQYVIQDNVTQSIVYDETISMSCGMPSPLGMSSIMDSMVASAFGQTQEEQIQENTKRNIEDTENGRRCSAIENITQLIQSLNLKF